MDCDCQDMFKLLDAAAIRPLTSSKVVILESHSKIQAFAVINRLHLENPVKYLLFRVKIQHSPHLPVQMPLVTLEYPDTLNMNIKRGCIMQEARPVPIRVKVGKGNPFTILARSCHFDTSF